MIATRFHKKTEPAKVVVWGIGEDYDNVYNSIELQILKNNIEIVAFCCREVDKISPTFEEKPLITKMNSANLRLII